MTDSVEPDVSMDELSKWIRDHPESLAEPSPAASITDERLARIADLALSRIQIESTRRRGRRRRIGAIAVGGVSAMVGAVGVAAWLQSESPGAPQAGVVCRADAQVDADAVVVGPDLDPVGACREVWDSGGLVEKSGSTDLVACIGAGDAIEVFPGDESTCGALGLVLADLVPTVDNTAIVALQERLSDEINAQPCASVSTVADAAEAILGETSLLGWMVEIDPASQGGVCGKADVDPESSTVRVVEF